MKTRFLFPHQFRPLGWLMAIPGLVLGYFVLYNDYRIPGFGLSVNPGSHFFPNPPYEDLTNELALILVVTGLFLIAFSREKEEDELTIKMRQNALYWSVLLSYMVYVIWLLLVIVTRIAGTKIEFLGHLGDMLEVSIYNTIAPLVIFIVRYYYLRYSQNGIYEIGKLLYLPEKPYKRLGQIISIPLLAAFIILFVNKYLSNQDLDMTIGIGVITMLWPVAMLIWGFSRQKGEDEFVSTLRLESMQLAVYVNYAILMLANLFLFYNAFILVLYLNLGTIALFFVIRFNYILWKYNHQNGRGELVV